MEIIQSFWSKPSFHTNQNFQNSRKFGGWLSYKYFLLSTCFSCLTIKRHHDKVKLYTDTKGYEIFINQLDLPYDNISLILDELDQQDHRLWVLGKLKVLSMQNKPFVHIDNDVFLWKKMSNKFLKGPLIAQSIHLLPQPYKQNLKGVLDNFSNIPKCLNNIPKQGDVIANIGIIGGNDLDFFHEYCRTAYSLLNDNIDNLKRVNIGGFNQILDEYLFTCLSKHSQTPVDYLINNIEYKNPNIELYEHVLRFHLVPIIDKYIHVVGTAKQSIHACEQIEMRFKYEFPDFYKKVCRSIELNYPELFINPANTPNDKHNKLIQSMSKLYTWNLDKLMRAKIGLSEGFSIIKHNVPDTNAESYMLSYNDQLNETVSSEQLTGANNILIYFQQSISIQDFLEYINANEQCINLEEYTELKNNVISIVLEKIIISGQLMFEDDK